MTLSDLEQLPMLRRLTPEPPAPRPVESVFCCDLLSVAMCNAPAGCAWVTVMGNINTLAVVALTDAACVILAGGVQLDPPAAQRAVQQGITVLATDQPVFEAALAVHQRLHG